MRIPPFLFGILILAIFLGIILGFQSAGIWSVSGKITNRGDAVQPSADDVDTIKGWMTLEQISTAYNVPLADILTQFNLPGDTQASTAIKDLESDVFTVTDLRLWLESRIEPAQSQSTPASIPQATATLPSVATDTVLAPLSTEHLVSARAITGKTTFQDLLDWGVRDETIRQIIGGDLPIPATVTREYANQKGMQFSTIKTALQVEVDRIK